MPRTRNCGILNSFSKHVSSPLDVSTLIHRLPPSLKLLCAFLLFASNAGWACTGRVVGVTDGDTIKVLCNRTEIKVRLAEIDAPEKRQPFGSKAKSELSQLVFGREVRLEIASRDRYGRSIATVWIGATDANREMIRRGYAWAYRKYLHDLSLIDVEKQARAAKRGLWSESEPIAPWDFRQQRRSR